MTNTGPTQKKAQPKKGVKGFGLSKPGRMRYGIELITSKWEKRRKKRRFCSLWCPKLSKNMWEIHVSSYILYFSLNVIAWAFSTGSTVPQDGPWDRRSMDRRSLGRRSLGRSSVGTGVFGPYSMASESKEFLTLIQKKYTVWVTVSATFSGRSWPQTFRGLMWPP